MKKNSDYIIPPIDRELLKSELNESVFVRKTNKGNNEIYIVNHHNSPNTMLEIGRLRELSFSEAGGGTGQEVDIDKYDTSENCYEQLIVFSPEDQEISGGYRFIDCSKIINTDPIALSTAHYFTFSDTFIKNYLPYTIELGRSWVQPNFQPSVNPRKGVFALDNLWDGLGAIAVDNPHIKHFFGKMTMYTNYNIEARDALLYFMNYYFPDPEKIVVPTVPIEVKSSLVDFKKNITGLDFKEGIRVLNSYLKERGEFIPPLINSYMSLSPTMKSFGTAPNKEFGEVEETAILVTIDDIYDHKKTRHIDTYKK
ncbi:MAG: GNAT family N-acetyltransferase [Cyclobacteriaceae bacterium]|nr:GNAT family N-acetyltransferase [Cyclobacteriaceae bacterium]